LAYSQKSVSNLPY